MCDCCRVCTRLVTSGNSGLNSKLDFIIISRDEQGASDGRRQQRGGAGGGGGGGAPPRGGGCFNHLAPRAGGRG